MRQPAYCTLSILQMQKARLVAVTSLCLDGRPFHLSTVCCCTQLRGAGGASCCCAGCSGGLRLTALSGTGMRAARACSLLCCLA